jgi:hypothetical protein
MIGVQGAVHRQGQLAGFKPNAFFHTYGEFANNAAKAKSIGLVVTLTTLVADSLGFKFWGALLLYSLVL